MSCKVHLLSTWSPDDGATGMGRDQWGGYFHQWLNLLMGSLKDEA